MTRKDKIKKIKDWLSNVDSDFNNNSIFTDASEFSSCCAFQEIGGFVDDLPEFLDGIDEDYPFEENELMDAIFRYKAVMDFQRESKNRYYNVFTLAHKSQAYLYNLVEELVMAGFVQKLTTIKSKRTKNVISMYMINDSIAKLSTTQVDKIAFKNVK